MSQPVSFALSPFEPPVSTTASTTASTQDLTISGTVVRNQAQLSISYTLAGDLHKVRLPFGEGRSLRRDRLWTQTCFEFFLAEGAVRSPRSPYWEFNLSPAGDWNVFSLSGYRQGLKEETAVAALPFTVCASPNKLQLKISVDLADLIDPLQPLRLGIATVVVLTTGEETFWAIAHCGAEPDFHHSDSFVIELLA